MVPDAMLSTVHTFAHPFSPHSDPVQEVAIIIIPSKNFLLKSYIHMQKNV